MNAAHYDRIITGCIMYTKEKKIENKVKIQSGVQQKAQHCWWNLKDMK